MSSMMREGEIVSTEYAAYRLVYELGSGGMGEVWEAKNILTDDKVAIKFMLNNRDVLPARLRREARLLRGLSHPNIVKLVEVGETREGKPFLVLELLSGETLHLRLRVGGALPIYEAVWVGCEIASALVAAHKMGVMHRDLKPGNVFLRQGPDGAEGVVVIDFGIAKDLNTEEQSVVTTIGSLVGSIEYMSPEQLSGQQVDCRTDIWSLGLLLYEMIEGQKRFRGKTVPVILRQIQQGETPIPWNQPVPRELDFLVASCLEIHPAKRIQTAQEVLDKLVCILESSATARPTAPTTRTNLPSHEYIPINAGSLVSSNVPVYAPNHVPTNVPDVLTEIVRNDQRDSARHRRLARRITYSAVGLGLIGTATLIVCLAAVVKNPAKGAPPPPPPPPPPSCNVVDPGNPSMILDASVPTAMDEARKADDREDPSGGANTANDPPATTKRVSADKPQSSPSDDTLSNAPTPSSAPPNEKLDVKNGPPKACPDGTKSTKSEKTN